MSRWGDMKTIKFIHMYREHQCLWDPFNKYYKDKIARENAYIKIKDEFNLTIKDIKNKIRSLRATYLQEFNKVQKSKRSGAKSNNVYRPKLIWFEEMDFLNHTFEYRESTDTEVQPPPQTRFVIIEPPRTVQQAQPSSQLTIKKTFQSGRKRVEQNETVTELQHLENIPNNSRYSDEFDHFGLNVAAQLRSLPLNSALELQYQFLDMLSKERSSLSDLYSQQDNSEMDCTQTESTESINIEFPPIKSMNEVSAIKLEEAIPFMTESKDESIPIQLKNIKISSVASMKRKTQTEETETNPKKACPNFCVYDDVSDNVIETAASDSDPFGVYVGEKMKCIKSEKQKTIVECLITTVFKKAFLNTLSENTTVE